MAYGSVTSVDKPNVVLPLAASYNERGIKGLDTTVTRGVDQRKINSIYEPVKNAMTGKLSLYLVKRNGVERESGNNSYGVSSQTSYLVSQSAGGFGEASATQWVYSTSGNDIRASNSVTTQTITTASGYKPVYVGKMSVSGVDTVVLQLRDSTGVQTVWYSSTIATWSQITDSDFPAVLGKMAFMDGYAFAVSGSNGAVYNSDLNSISAWTATSYIPKQIKQDPAVGLMRFNKHILAAGRGTTEVFVNAGNPSGSPLISAPNLFGRYGITVGSTLVGATDYSCMCGNKLYFLARPENSLSSSVIVAYDGQGFVKVSNVAIDKILTDAFFVIYSVNAVIFDGKYAVAVSLTAPTAGTQKWLMYFPDWNEWFEWNSTVFMPVNNGIHFIGVSSNANKLYMLSFNSNNYQDAGTDYTWTHQFQIPDNGNFRKTMPYFGLKGATVSSGQLINVEFSDDDYSTFSTARTIDMSTQQKYITRCGAWHGQRVVRLSHTGNSEVRIESALMRIE